jgi:hypothetical protein
VPYESLPPELQAVVDGAGEDIIHELYERLQTFQCKDGGYEYFGQCPGNEIMTAYTYMCLSVLGQEYDFIDMHNLTSHLQWLMKRISSNQFVQSTTIVDNGRPQAATANAFIIWALA